MLFEIKVDISFRPKGKQTAASRDSSLSSDPPDSWSLVGPPVLEVEECLTVVLAVVGEVETVEVEAGKKEASASLLRSLFKFETVDGGRVRGDIAWAELSGGSACVGEVPTSSDCLRSLLISSRFESKSIGGLLECWIPSYNVIPEQSCYC